MGKLEHQSGFTLTELMISVTLSMSVIGSLLTSYAATQINTVKLLSSNRLDQDLSALINLMANEMRRVGYRANLTETYLPNTNPPVETETSTLQLYSNSSSETQASVTGVGTCLLYTYDRDEDGQFELHEAAGFRLVDGVVQMRVAVTSSTSQGCTSANNSWISLTDPDFITVTSLTFNLGESRCFNTREPDEVDNDQDGQVDNPEEFNCYSESQPVAASGDTTVEARQIRITLTANLESDSFIEQTYTLYERIRNDPVRVR